MTIFDLLFLALVLVSVATLLTAAAAAISRRRARALGILKTWATGFVAYMAVVATVSLALPRRVLRVGDPLCNDDWCIAVESVHQEPAAGGTAYRVGLRIFSRARRVWQRERGVSIYLTDAEEHRYDPRPSPADVPFDVVLGPQQSVAAERIFDTPPGLREPGLVIRLGSGFPIGWFIIGYDTWFRKPVMVRVAE